MKTLEDNNITNITKDFKRKVIDIFDAKEINHRTLHIACKKIDNGEEINWSDYDNSSKHDVGTSENCKQYG